MQTDSAKPADSGANSPTAADGQESSTLNKVYSKSNAKPDTSKGDSSTVLELSSTEKAEQVAATLKQLMAPKFPKSEEVKFDEIGFEDDYGQLRKGEEEDLILSLEMKNRAIRDYHHMRDDEDFL